MELSSMSPEAIPALSMAMAQSRVANQAGTMVLAKTLDISEQGGQALINMMRSSMEISVNPSVGSNFDVSV